MANLVFMRAISVEYLECSCPGETGYYSEWGAERVGVDPILLLLELYPLSETPELREQLIFFFLSHLACPSLELGMKNLTTPLSSPSLKLQLGTFCAETLQDCTSFPLFLLVSEPSRRRKSRSGRGKEEEEETGEEKKKKRGYLLLPCAAVLLPLPVPPAAAVAAAGATCRCCCCC
ncbi:hypothetical protein CKAN_00882100 [Cinnamomum micranthum f. kanehirae]|uniref:Uncharacterized protein n=1 Tax=Cinnamomum micranthum f. kanehirae TaxID=337451 RepID=A0A3S4NQB7_9MAGN|nr:hypothetical protein CKAN_00882100 [Cinnamomum micranthum f. kanehirae]